jgi:2-hydroxy-6-oxonona-2,4-dienedioate hydrolase
MLLDYLAAGTGRAWRTFRYALEDHIEERLPQVRVPVLVVRGSRDPIVPQRWAEEAARLLSMGKIVVVPGSAHVANFDAPLELARVIRAFLDEEQ